MFGRSWSIRGWLGILIAAVGVPLLMLLLVIFVWQVRRERAEAREAALQMARSIGAGVRAQQERSAALLAQMARRPAIRDFDGSTCDSLFEVVDFFPHWSDLLFYDATGAVVCSARPTGETMALALAVQKATVAEVHRGDLLSRKEIVRFLRGRWLSVVVQPVIGSRGEARGTLALLQVHDFAPNALVLPNAIVTSLDRDGRIVSPSIAADPLIEIAPGALQKLEGQAEARRLEGGSRQYGVATIPELGSTVCVEVPMSDDMRPVQEAFVLGAAGGVAILLLITLVAKMFSRGIEKPVRALIRATESAAGSGYGRTESLGGPLEIAQLSAAFNAMIERRSAAELRTLESERNLKALSERLLDVQEHERMRVARELHDDLGQALTALKMDVIGLVEKSRFTPEMTPMVDRILRTLDSTVTAVQRISSELRPSVLDDLGLIAALESEARVFEERSGIECELSLPDEPPEVGEVAATAIYRMVQEALTNVARHSNAARVEIRVRERGEELFLEIRDDGRGIPSEDLTNPSSLGLAGIRERAAMLGGAAAIEGVPGHGTIVSIRMPTVAKRGSER